MDGQPMDRTTPDPLPRSCGGVVLRRLALTDLADFQAYRHDPEVGRYQGWEPVPDDRAAAFLAEMSEVPLLQPGEWAQIAIADAGDNRLIGDIGLFLAADGTYAEIGFSMARASQGRGLATIAVREAIRLVIALTPVERIIAIADARNTPSIRLLERVGMTRVGSTDTTFRGEPAVEYTYTLHNNRIA